MVTACATVYADLIFGRVQATGFFADDSKVSLLSVEVCVPLNDLEHGKCALAVVPQTLQVSAVASAFDSSHASVDDQRSLPPPSFHWSPLAGRGWSRRLLLIGAVALHPMSTGFINVRLELRPCDTIKPLHKLPKRITNHPENDPTTSLTPFGGICYRLT